VIAHRRLSVAILVAAACAPGPSVVPIESADRCGTVGLELARSYGPNVHLVAAFVTTVADVASWHSAVGGPGSVPSGRPLDGVDICYYDGAVVAKAPSPANARPHGRVRIIVAADGAHLDAAGSAETFPLASPPHRP
jgi:hypothetical protein